MRKKLNVFIDAIETFFTHFEIVKLGHLHGKVLKGAVADVKVSQLSEMFQQIRVEIVGIVVADYETLDPLDLRFAVWKICQT